MNVIFLDFDGVLNSEASFRYEARRRTQDMLRILSPIACSNLQYVLEQDSSIKLVVSSTGRAIHPLQQLQEILSSYGVSGAHVIGKTPMTVSGDRGLEIRMWLEDNPNVTRYVILDDNAMVKSALFDADGHEDARGYFFETTPEDGLLLSQAKRIAKLFRGEK